MNIMKEEHKAKGNSQINQKREVAEIRNSANELVFVEESGHCNEFQWSGCKERPPTET